MRELKFRGKRVDNGEWIFGSLVLYTQDGFQRADIIQRHDILDFDYHGKDIRIPVKPETVGQYTGLKDKNGKEAYFKDIVESGEFGKLIIVWDEEYSRIALKSTVNKYMISIGILKFCEIIGNIYENPELLEQRTEKKGGGRWYL